MHTDKRGYGYETFRDGGRVCRRYIGRGVWVGAAVYLDRLDRERDDDDRQRERAPLESMRASEAALNAYCGALDGLVSDAMHAGGYHRHKRGNWRKRRAAHTQTIMSKPKTELAKETTSAPTRDLLAHSLKDHGAAVEYLDGLEGLVEEFMIDELANVRAMAMEGMVQNCSGADELTREAYRRQLDKTAREIAGHNPTPLETQLADRVALCALSVARLENIYANCIMHGSQTRVFKNRWALARNGGAARSSRFLKTLLNWFFSNSQASMSFDKVGSK